MQYYIDSLVLAKMKHMIQKAGSKEVSGLGKVEIHNGAYYVTSVVMCKQANHTSETEMDAADIGKAMFEMKDTPGHLCFWWHSHPFSAHTPSWSPTDLATIRKNGKNGFFLAIVFGKNCEAHKSAFFQAATDCLPELFIDADMKEDYGIPASFYEQWDAEYSSKVVATIRPKKDKGSSNRSGYYDAATNRWVPFQNGAALSGKDKTTSTGTAKTVKRQQTMKGTKVLGNADTEHSMTHSDTETNGATGGTINEACLPRDVQKLRKRMRALRDFVRKTSKQKGTPLEAPGFNKLTEAAKQLWVHAHCDFKGYMPTCQRELDEFYMDWFMIPVDKFFEQ